jgi:type IV secretion system protein VirB5
MFRRPSVRYGTTPEPVTPYQKAAQVWDERIGSARVQARNWRLMALGCLALSTGLSAALAWHLARFVENVRQVPADPIVLRQSWLRAYDFATDRGAIALNDYARVNDPFALVGDTQVSVEVSSVIRASDTSFRVAWVERRYENGQLAATERWTAILSVVVQPPRDAERLRANPLGVYVHAINWSRESAQ